MLIRLVVQVSEGKSMKMKKDWTCLEDMSNNLPLAVISSEDQKFTKHFGFDFVGGSFFAGEPVFQDERRDAR